MHSILLLCFVITFTCDASSGSGVDSCPELFCMKGFHRDFSLPCPKCVPDNCKPNEVYTECGSACPDTCDNYKDKERICTLQCIIGCVCKPDFVKDKDGNCINPKDCPKVKPCDCPKPCNCPKPCDCAHKPPRCKPNEFYDDCGSSCPDTCENINDKDRMCTMECVPGCFCKPGLVKDKDGNCIDPKDCRKEKPCDCPKPCNCSKPCDCPNKPKDCGPHAHYSNCASPCPPMCIESKIPRSCAAVCIKGCKCDDGYILYNKNGPCVPKSFCPKKSCGANEHYTTCGTSVPLTCDNYRNPPKTCRIGCECHEGYVRSSDGRCVKPTDCPTTPGSFCPVRDPRVCIRRQNQCCTDLDCKKPGQMCCQENCGYECRDAVNAPTTGEAAFEPGCPIG